MYKSVLLSCVAFTPQAIKLGLSTSSESTSKEDNAVMEVIEQAVQDIAPTAVTDSQTSGSHDCGCHQGCASSCGCGCHDDNQPQIHLPIGTYENPQIEGIAQGMVDSLDPEVIDLTLDLGLSAEEMASMERDVLLLAFENAIHAMLSTNPALDGMMVDMPTNLDTLIDRVMAATSHATSSTDEEGVVTSSYSGNGSIHSIEDFNVISSFSDYTPSVYFLSSEASHEACDALEDQWTSIQKTHLGAAYFRISTDEVPQISSVLNFETTPYFIVVHQDNEVYSGDGADWGNLVRQLSTAIQTAELGADRSRLTVDATFEGLDLSSDLIREVAGQFGITDIEEHEV